MHQHQIKLRRNLLVRLCKWSPQYETEVTDVNATEFCKLNYLKVKMYFCE